MAEITIKDIAKECGVGVSTVSRALNNHPDINPETRRKIMEVIERTGFIPNNSARNLKRTDAKCIAMLVKGITNPFFSKMIEIIEDEAKRKRYALVLRHVEAQEDELDVALELEKEKRLRGIVFLGGMFRHSQEKLDKLKVPYIFCAISVEAFAQAGEAKFSNIAVDDCLESRKMTEYLLDLGHRRIAFITENMDESIGRSRLEGYRNAYMGRGLEVPEELICYVQEDVNHYGMENGYLTTIKLLRSGREVTAIYAAADSLAIGACRAVLEAGLRIPEDISIVGFDNYLYEGLCDISITSYEVDIKEMVRCAIKIVLSLAEHGSVPADMRLVSGTVVVKESVRRME